LPPPHSPLPPYTTLFRSTTAAAPPAATLQPPAEPAPRQLDPRDLHRKTWLGHVAESIHDSVHGVETTYKINPETGEMETGRVEIAKEHMYKPQIHEHHVF